jgi:nucleoside-diphosphate-sugar epimerase
MSSVLFVGGTGQISLPCVEKAVAAGHDVSVFNRGQRDAGLPAGVTSIVGDMRDPASYRGALGGKTFDVVAQFMVFTPDQLQQDIEVFAGNTGQYVFISSASVYDKSNHYVVKEGVTPVHNPFWAYSQAKIACEKLLEGSKNLPWTIVRPSHTVRTGLPTMVGEGDVIPRRMLQGKPVFVAGDGTAPWTLTRSVDFANPFIGLFGKSKAIGEDFHITGDMAWTWTQIYKAIARGIGAEANIVCVPSDTLVKYRPDWVGPLWGDKSLASLFDNSKVKAVAGDFTCSEDLDEVLAEPIMHLKQRLQEPEAPSELTPLLDRITADQLNVGG